MYVGIDPSLTGTGIVILDSSKKIIVSTCIETTNDCYICNEQRLLDIIDSIFNILDCHNIKNLCIEGLSNGSMSTSSQERFGLFFLITTNLFKKDIPFKVIPPKSLKKKISGNGNADKKYMMNYIKENYDVDFNNNDNIYDAYGLAILALEE